MSSSTQCVIAPVARYLRFARFMRPKEVGAIGFLFGLALLANSQLLLVCAGVWSIWFLLAPIAEESWLRELLGAPYEEYVLLTRRYL